MIKFKTLRTRIFVILASTILFVAGLISFYLVYDLKFRSYQAFDSVTKTINDILISNIKGFVYNPNNKKNIQYAIESIKSPYINNILILDKQGRVISSQKIKNSSNLYYEHFKELIEASNHTIQNNNQRIILSSFPLLKMPLNYLIVEANIKHYNDILYEELKGLIIMILSLFALTLSIAYYLSKTLSQPMYNIIETLQKTKNNEVLIFKDESEKEFNYLISSISKKHNSLLILNAELEKKVDKKTIELQKLNRSLEEKIEKAVKDAQHKEQLFHQQTRLAQMGEMIGMIAHQWRQPLAVMSSIIMLIDRHIETDKYNLQDPKEKEKFIDFLEQKHDDIHRHIAYLSSTTDDFRNFFNPHTKKNSILINRPVNKAIQLMKSSIKNKNIETTINLDATLICKLYENEIMQVILNIIKNATDSLLESKQKNKQITIHTYNKQTRAIIKICDNGVGIPKSIQEKIFDPYFSTKDQKMGTGLGLYMSKNIVEEHNKGVLEFKTEGKKTCFILSFLSE